MLQGVSEDLVKFFGGEETNSLDPNLLGGKGAGLAAMSQLGIPVPPGFTLTTLVCNSYFENDHDFPAGLTDLVNEGLEHVQHITGTEFGN